MKKILFLLLALATTSTFAQESPTDTAQLLFKSRGEAMNVIFKTSTHEEPCEGMTQAAGVYDAELLREKLLPFIAKMQQKARKATGIYPQVEQTVAANVPLQITSKSSWYDKVGSMSSSGSCGPFANKFTPEAGRKYLVLFEFSGGSCGQSVKDITNAEEEPVPVTLEPLICPTSFFSGW